MRSLILAVAGCATMATIPAEAQTRRVGPWQVATERNRFDDGNSTVVATQIHRGVALGVRCLADRQFSLGIMEVGFGTGRLSQGMAVSAMVRIDNNPIERPPAAVVNDRLVQINLPIGKAEQLLRGREIAIRLEVGPGSTDHIFPLTQSQRALGPVLEACRQPSAPERAEPVGFFDFDKEGARQRMQAALQGVQSSISIPVFECRKTLSETRSCVSRATPAIEIAVWEKMPRGANAETFRRGEGPARPDTLLVTLNIDDAPGEAERATFFGLCTSALKAASPSLEMGALQRRIEASYRQAVERKGNDVIGVGSSTSTTDTLEMELTRGEVTCLVYAKGR